MNLLYLIVLFPLIGYLLLVFFHNFWSQKLVNFIGIGSIGLSALSTIFVAVEFFTTEQQHFYQELWSWIYVENFNIKINFFLDGLSLTMISVITGIGLLIHIFSSWYMFDQEGYSRYFAYTNLFIASMLILVLADNFMLMYLGWEGVGLCSYLLIGFYYNNVKNGKAALKAFIVTRIGDVFLAFALFIIYNEFNTLNISELIKFSLLDCAKFHHSILELAVLMLLAGAIGKSAQFPLQVWLPDAMAGPTPVSALIHAATMVTAGVYLIARTHNLFLLAPQILNLVAIIGAITLIISSCSALVQTDIKRILAYSTMSQIGYMFLALGVQAWHAAIFHLMIHAFFKALLFLAAGSLILSCHHEQNIFKMGGLRKKIPFIYFCFLVGGSSLTALPVLTAGFYSKEQILVATLVDGHICLTITGLIGALLTSLYTFRLIFIVFHGEQKINADAIKSFTHHFPLIVLLVLSTFLGIFIIQPLIKVLPQNNFSDAGGMILATISSLITIFGVLLSKWLWLDKHKSFIYISNSILGRFFSSFWFVGFGFDWLYDKIFVKTYMRITCLLQHDPLNSLMNLPVLISKISNRGLLISQNGYLRWYIASMSIGAILILALMLLYNN
ncbi:NADH-quinone oxidoreductase subunit L [Candidatus Pantoea carbekii]|uniref:NADH-quinone oxidoreductase subunit L n=1 Tax=Candidatus Pantoea carbekii TaxID=1235990 RepID=U3U7V1_9GAMM|nr:NADH-quinone oxidoreductase subunit L [Candidatus Pantoea carbekii]AKC32000.1 NADH-quinone oxidoreductase chain L NuoL [Candidatus Pantoea carbekii]BAO00522.1 NuoL protein [Candidatus Pantoea carbekii]